MHKLINKINDSIDYYKNSGYLSILKDLNFFFSKNFFDMKEFDVNAWYYNKTLVQKYKQEILRLNPNRRWYEEDHFLLLTKGFVLLLNYEIFVYFVIILYFAFLMFLLYCAYNFYWIDIIYVF